MNANAIVRRSVITRCLPARCHYSSERAKEEPAIELQPAAGCNARNGAGRLFPIAPKMMEIGSSTSAMSSTTTPLADAARANATYLSFWSFMALWFGAIAATLAGILGGELRDEDP